MASMRTVNKLQVRFSARLALGRLTRCPVLLTSVLFESYIDNEKNVTVASSDRNELITCLRILKRVLEDMVPPALPSGLNRFTGVRTSVLSIMFSITVYMLVRNDSLNSMGKSLSIVAVKAPVLLKTK